MLRLLAGREGAGRGLAKPCSLAWTAELEQSRGHPALTESVCRTISSWQVKPQPEPLVASLLTGGKASTFITVQKTHVVR